MERKVFAMSEIKLADAESDTTEMRFSGYGAVFNNVDSYGDVIEAGAFAKSLEEAQKSGIYPSMLLQHGGWGMGSQDLMPIGVWDKLSEDGKGLVSEGILAKTAHGEEAYTLMKMKPRPAITGLSIGYIAKKFTARSKPDEPRRRLHEVDLMEVSLLIAFLGKCLESHANSRIVIRRHEQGIEREHFTFRPAHLSNDDEYVPRFVSDFVV